MKQGFKKACDIISEKFVYFFNYKPYIQTILLHKIYNSRNEIIPENGTIAEGIDKSQFESFIRYFKKRGVEFIDETDILNDKIDPNKQYIYLTFDDGYFNNFYCLDILEKYKVKATFFISTNHVQYQKAYWWDVVYREMHRRKIAETKILQQIEYLCTLRWIEQEDYLREHFGDSSLNPINDLDRPMNSSELKIFGSHPYVTIGNHTHNHLNLTLYHKQEIIDSVKTAEIYLNSVIDQKISAISYPYGFYNNECIEAVNSLNYKIGITVDHGKNAIFKQCDSDILLQLKRIQLHGYCNMEEQCRNLHINFSPISKIKNFIGRK